MIVLPRGLPDPKRSIVDPKNELKADLELWKNQDAANLFTRIAVADQGGPELEPKAAQKGSNPDRPWHVLKQLILAISRHIPIVCAAGNSGESQLIYPASLAADNNGIIAVGAVTVEGFRSGYSNYGEGLTVVSPLTTGRSSTGISCASTGFLRLPRSTTTALFERGNTTIRTSRC